MKQSHRFGRMYVAAIAAVMLSVLVTHLPAYADAQETAAQLLEQVKYLSSDELEGRGVGTEGLNRAAHFIRQKFAEAGLDVTRVGGDAYQKFDMVTGSELGSPNSLELVGPHGNVLELKLENDFRPCSFGGAGKFEGGIVFAGYGIDANDENYNDFAKIDVQDKIVIIMRRVPQQDNPHGPFSGPHGSISRHGDLRSKVSNAFGKGAAAILFVNDPHTTRNESRKQQEQIAKAEAEVVAAAEEFEAADPQNEQQVAETKQQLSQAVQKLKAARAAAKEAAADVLMEFGYGGHSESRTIPVLHIKQDVCDQLLKASLGKTLEQIEADIDSDLQPRSAELTGWTARGTTTVKQVRTKVKNVIGVLEGEGPLADEAIVVGAHYDHVGLGGVGSLAPGVKAVHNGADDNASGTVALIELARRLASREEKLARRVVFIAFTAEEIGLIGSARYVKEPIHPLEKTIAMLNMDMVGRLENDKLTVFGTGTAERWKELLQERGRKQGFELSLKPEGFGPSDHSSFYAKKIPVLHFFTGTHRDYHRPSDDWDKLNIPGMVRVIDLIEEVIVNTANHRERPKYVQIESRANLLRSGSRPYFGSIPDFGSNEAGYALSGVSPGSPADQGGLKGGDVIIEFGGEKIGNLSDFDLALRKFSAGDEVEVVVLRNGEKKTLTVTLDKPR